MPSENTWSSVAGLKIPAANGRVRSWVVTPNYGALPKDSKPVNVYDDVRYRTALSSTLAYYQTGTGPITTQVNAVEITGQDAVNAGASDSTSVGWGTLVSSMKNAASLKAYVKVADAKVNVAVAYAEASKTSQLIFETARRLDKAYRAFRKGDLKGVAQNLNITPKRLHKSWLEYKYGWMPLLMDVKGAAEFFAQQHVTRPPRFVVKASEEVTKTYDLSYNSQAYGGVPGDWRVTRTLSNHAKVTVKIWCELSNPHAAALQQIGLTNPALVAWELVPFSFVFDWFVSVGDWLTGLTALNGVTIRRQMISTVQDIGWVQTAPATVRLLSGVTYRHSGWNWISSARSYNRHWNVPSPWTLTPPVTNNFGFTKLVTSLALIQGSYRGTARTSRI